MDLACAQIDPLERVARVVHFDPLAWRELARGHRRLSVLRKLAIKLLPEVRVSRERLRALFPDELQRVTQAELVHDLRPIKLRHPQRVGTGLGLIGRAAHPIAHFPHRDSRAPQRSRNLPNPTAFLQPSLNLFVSIHRELPPRHCDPFSPFAQNRQRYRAKPLCKAARAGGSNPRKSGGSNFRKSGGPHPRKLGGSNQRKFCTLPITSAVSRDIEFVARSTCRTCS